MGENPLSQLDARRVGQKVPIKGQPLGSHVGQSLPDQHETKRRHPHQRPDLRGPFEEGGVTPERRSGGGSQAWLVHYDALGLASVRGCCGVAPSLGSEGRPGRGLANAQPLVARPVAPQEIIGPYRCCSSGPTRRRTCAGQGWDSPVGFAGHRRESESLLALCQRRIRRPGMPLRSN